jgi:hypothetical protein
VPKQPLAEVFGFPIDNFSEEAERYRSSRLCPYNNKVPSCTKDRANAPLGVCSMYEGDDITIICPIRFRQDWLIVEHAAEFFFPGHRLWTSLTEVRLNDKYGETAGNLDVVLVAYDNNGRLVDFGALEIQAVYISGNIRRPFEHYLEDPAGRYKMEWTGQKNYPHPDYLSSSRKRLAPQLLYKGTILNTWGKKLAVATHSGLYKTLPCLPEVDPRKADVAWLVYDLNYDAGENRYKLILSQKAHTLFKPALDKITMPEPGSIEDFIELLQEKLEEKLESDHYPDTMTLTDLFNL